MINYREHPKFLFVKEEIEKYFSSGEKLGRVYLQDPEDINQKREKIQRCPLGVVAFNHGFLIVNAALETYEELKNRFDLTVEFGFGFDAASNDSRYLSKNGCENLMIGQEIGLYCIENNLIQCKEIE